MAQARAKIIRRSIAGVIAFLVTAFVSGIVVGYLEASGVRIDVSGAFFWSALAVAVIAMVGSMVIGTIWMRSIDEAAQEAHKSAWYWGGSAGMAVGGVLVILSVLPTAASVSLPSISGRTDPVAYAAAGAFAMLLLMLIGYGVVWAWWWLSRTRG